MNALEALLELDTARARLEVHRSSSVWRPGLRIIADERQTAPATARRASTTRCSTPASAWRWPRALSTSPLLAARGGRALDASRGEPAFVFELDGRTLAFVVEGLGTKSMIARAVLEQQRRQPLRRRRLRHGRGDRQRPLLRRRAAAGRERLLRDRLLGVVRARASARGALLEGWRAACADAGCDVGRRRVAVAARAARRGRDRARRRGGRRGARRAARRSSASACAPAMRSCSSPVSGLHANGASLARLIAAAPARRLRDALPERRAASARRCSTPSVDVRAARRGAARRRSVPVHLPQPHHRPRAAEADAPARAS